MEVFAYGKKQGSSAYKYYIQSGIYDSWGTGKDAGKKLCAINKLEKSSMIHPVIDDLLAQGGEKSVKNPLDSQPYFKFKICI